MKMNVIIVYNFAEDKVLMCLRAKNPYKGLYNLVGGKIEHGEEGIDSAYRELEEETGIGKSEIELSHLMNFQYIYKDLELQVYYGTLNREVELVEEVNKLYWIDIKDNFFDYNKYAGEGNIGHMLEQVKVIESKIL